MGKIRWHSAIGADIQQSLTLKFLTMSEAGNETYLGLTYQDFQANSIRRYAATQRDILDMNHRHASLTHTIALSPGMNLTTSLYAARTFRDWARVNSIGGVSIANLLADPASNSNAYQIMTGQADGNLNYQSAARTFLVSGLQSNWSYRFDTGSMQHHLQAGMRLHQDEADRYATQSAYLMSNGDMRLNIAGIKGNAENQIRQAKSFAGYLQYEVLIKKFSITPGLRYEAMELAFDNYGNNDNARAGNALKFASNKLDILLPGVGISYAWKENMRFFGGVHRGFSPPGMPSVNSKVSQAQSETAINYELGYRVNKKNFKSQVIAFVNNYQNILGSDNVSSGGAGTGDMFNAGKAIFKELSSVWNITCWENLPSIGFPLM